MPKIPKRQTCGVCGQTPCLDFKVANWVWKEAVHPSRINDIHCFDCFRSRADEKLLPWDKSIEFFPVSMYTHIDAINEAGRVEMDQDGE